jgi:hypothetical protein
MSISPTLARWLAMACLAVCPLMSGCGDGDEKAAIEESWEKLTSAMAAQDPKAYMETLSPQSMRYYDTLCQQIRTSKHDEVRRMETADKATIIMMRNRCTKDELKKLDGKGLVEMAMTRGWMGGERRSEVTLGKIQLHGTSARGQLVVRDTETDIWMDFYKEGEGWKVDLTRGNEQMNEAFDRMARMFGVSVDDYILGRERQFGKPCAGDVWDPPKL